MLSAGRSEIFTTHMVRGAWLEIDKAKLKNGRYFLVLGPLQYERFEPYYNEERRREIIRWIEEAKRVNGQEAGVQTNTIVPSQQSQLPVKGSNYQEWRPQDSKPSKPAPKK